MKGAERQLENKQLKSQFEARYNAETKATEQNIKQYNAKRAIAQQEKMKEDNKRELEKAKVELAAKQHEEMLRKKALFKSERRLAELATAKHRNSKHLMLLCLVV